MFETLPHRADLRIRVWGKDLEELFSSALAGMNEVLKPGFCREKRQFSKEIKFAVEASDSTVLFIDFLSQVLTASQERRAIFCKADFESLTSRAVAVKLQGIAVEGFDRDIKAVTYHEAEVKKNEKGEWETVVVFDV